MDSGFAALPRPGMTTKSAIHLQRGDEGLLRDVDLAEPSVWHETTGLICPRVWTDFCAGTHDVTTSGSGKRMAVNTDHTDNMRDIDAARADRDSNRRALQCCQGDDRIKHTRSPMIEKRLFQLFLSSRSADRTIALSQFVHLPCSTHHRPCAAFPNRVPILMIRTASWPPRRSLARCAQCGPSLDAGSGHEVWCRVECAMKQKIKPGECEYQGRLKSLLNNAFNAELQPLRSLETVTKKRRALKKRAARNSAFTKSSTTASC